jgi:hypothetical protein
MFGSIHPLPMILCKHISITAEYRHRDERKKRFVFLPSVMLFHARNNTPTEAVSKMVATNDPSTFELDP